VITAENPLVVNAEDFTTACWVPAAGHLGILEERCSVSTHNLVLLNVGKIHCPVCWAIL
jgi:hypothetical protein